MLTYECNFFNPFQVICNCGKIQLKAEAFEGMVGPKALHDQIILFFFTISRHFDFGAVSSSRCFEYSYGHFSSGTADYATSFLCKLFYSAANISGGSGSCATILKVQFFSIVQRIFFLYAIKLMLLWSIDRFYPL